MSEQALFDTAITSKSSINQINKIIAALSEIRTPVLTHEFDLQEMVAKYLTNHGIAFRREYPLGPRNRIDFFIPGGIGIELKKGKPTKKSVVAQLHRYTRFTEIQAIIFVIERYLDIPKEINGKQCICFPLNRLWGVALP